MSEDLYEAQVSPIEAAAIMGVARACHPLAPMVLGLFRDKALHDATTIATRLWDGRRFPSYLVVARDILRAMKKAGLIHEDTAGWYRLADPGLIPSGTATFDGPEIASGARVMAIGKAALYADGSVTLTLFDKYAVGELVSIGPAGQAVVNIGPWPMP